MILLVQYSKTFDPRNNVFFEEALIIDVAKVPVSCEFVQAPVESRYCSYFGIKRRRDALLKLYGPLER